ncbi:MAG: pyruvate kinase [Pseudomonadales bacterium]|nr:pyruvate kinase [Pseudomonadales bacterium]
MKKEKKARRTKIVATLGPATDDPNVLKRLFEAGVDVVRLNFSHGEAQDHIARAQAVRSLSKKTGRHVGILADLQGPKIRIARFSAGHIMLAKGDHFRIDINLDESIGDQLQVGCSYADLAVDLSVGDQLMLDDGRIVLEAKKIADGKIDCTVVVGGKLSDNKGINVQGGGLSASALTDKDKLGIITAANIEADFVAVSFPRGADDMNLARKLVIDAGSKALLVAKIERAEVIDQLEQIIDASDIVMVARGDLGVEIGDANLPAAQKRIIRVARSRNTAVITATQMMESMIENSIPTRAEVFDVANAVSDGTDAVMLSAETSVGKYPVETVKAMGRICSETERQPSNQLSDHQVGGQFETIDEAIALSAMYVANHTDVRAIAAFTDSGSTPLRMSRVSSGVPIFAILNDAAICRRVTIFRGVTPVLIALQQRGSPDVFKDAIDEFKRLKIVDVHDLVIFTAGELTGIHGGTNSMKIIQVE